MLSFTSMVFFLVYIVSFHCYCYRILGIFPESGRSHHIFFSSLMEELASRNHEVTVVNYLPVKKMPNIRRISIHKESDGDCINNMTRLMNAIPSSIFMDFYRMRKMALLFKKLANDNCERLVSNPEIKAMVNSTEKFDVVVVEQFCTDCGLAIAYKLNAPTVGVAAHMLKPWTYSRLGVPNNPAFVPNHLFATGTRPTFFNKIKSAVINVAMTAYYKNIIQPSDRNIVNKVYPDVPEFESLGNNMSLIMVNQYFPLTGARIQGPNVIEVGGMHIEKHAVPIEDKELKRFLDSATEHVVYISFGTIASRFPKKIIDEIVAFIEKSHLKFVWKTDNNSIQINSHNVLLRKWLPQPTVLCHPKVAAFVSHSGMLSTSEAIHCGVPIVSVPLFGDQFSNSAAAVEKGLAVALSIYSLDRDTLREAVLTVLQDSFKNRAKELSKLWRDRPMPPMDTAVFWIEYVARHKGLVEMRPSSVHLNTFEYFLLDVLLILLCVLYIAFKTLTYISSSIKSFKCNRTKIEKTD